MDSKRFDGLTRALATGQSRRSIIKGLFGLGAAAAVSSVLPDATEARRSSISTAPSTTTPAPTTTSLPPCAGVRCGHECCATADQCCDGECCAAGSVCLARRLDCSTSQCEEKCCTPLTCEDTPPAGLGEPCGTPWDDGCGGTIDCGCKEGICDPTQGVCVIPTTTLPPDVVACLGVANYDECVGMSGYCCNGQCYDTFECCNPNDCDVCAVCENFQCVEVQDHTQCVNDFCATAPNSTTCGGTNRCCNGVCQGCCDDRDCSDDDANCVEGQCFGGVCQDVYRCDSNQTCCPGSGGYCCDSDETCCSGECLAGTTCPVSCSGQQDCASIPTYCEQRSDGELLWRYHLCSGGFCTLTAHPCDSASGFCERNTCGATTDCGVEEIPAGETANDGVKTCCDVNADCAALASYCDGDLWTTYQCGGSTRVCTRTTVECGVGRCQAPIGCEIVEG